MKNINKSFLGLALLTVSFTSHAIILGFSPSSQSVTLGDSVDIELTISDLGHYMPDSLGAFDIDVLFDNTVLGLNNVTYGDPVLGDQLDLFSLGSLTSTTTGSGIVNILELSLDFAFDLDDLQESSFTLATLNFDTLATGESYLDIGAYTLSDSWGYALTSDTFQGQDTITVPSVPEPASLLMLSTALLGLIGFRRKFKDFKTKRGSF